jgi:thioesterase domain-containing protein
MVRQLKESGNSILLIAIIDSSPPFDVKKVKKRTTIERLMGILKKARALDFSFIRTIWIGRIKRPIQVKWISLVGDREERERILFQKKMKTLNLIYEAYIWKPLPVKITLIRSSEYVLNHQKNEKVKKWNKLALNGVDTYVVDGNHIDLFNEPEVKQLADQLRQCLDKAYE